MLEDASFVVYTRSSGFCTTAVAQHAIGRQSYSNAVNVASVTVASPGCELEDCGYILFATRPDPFLSVSYPSQPVPVRQISDPTPPAGLPVTRTRRSIHWNLQFA